MNLKERRTAAGLSQSQLAEASGIGLKAIQSLEQGTRDISRSEAGTVYKLSKALNCTMEDLVKENLKEI